MTPPSERSESARWPTLSPEKWFAEEVQPHEPALRAYLRGAYPSVRDVDDVVQESYLRLWKSCAVQRIRSGRAFLFTVARHVAQNLVARQRICPVVVVGDLAGLAVVEDRPDAAEAAARAETRRLLVEALAALAPCCRQITIMRKIQGMPQREIAAQLGISEKTVEEQVSRGVRRCEEFLRRRGVTRYLAT